MTAPQRAGWTHRHRRPGPVPGAAEPPAPRGHAPSHRAADASARVCGRREIDALEPEIPRGSIVPAGQCRFDDLAQLGLIGPGQRQERGGGVARIEHDESPGRGHQDRRVLAGLLDQLSGGDRSRSSVPACRSREPPRWPGPRASEALVRGARAPRARARRSLPGASSRDSKPALPGSRYMIESRSSPRAASPVAASRTSAVAPRSDRCNQTAWHGEFGLR